MTAARDHESDRLLRRTAIVTGGSKGIGKAIATAFVSNGANVVITARKPESLAVAAAELREVARGLGRGDAIETAVANAGDPDAPDQCVELTRARFGTVDILVNNAATSPYLGALIDIDIPRWEKTLAVNLRGPLLWAQACWRGHMQVHGGAIVNISSIGGQQFGGNSANYAISKAALDYLTRHLGIELAPTVRVNGIAPGLVRTDMARALWDRPDVRVPPMARIGEPSEIAELALFLASPASAWITGQVLNIDGGASVTDFERYPKRIGPRRYAPDITSG